MNLKLDDLRAFVEKQETDFGDPDIKTILDFLWSAYSYLNPVDNDHTREKIGELGELSTWMTFEDSNRLYDTVAALCFEIEHLAFVDGVRVGAQLAMELNVK